MSFFLIKIKKFLEYSKSYDLIWKFLHLRTYRWLNKSANGVLVFLAHGINFEWKFIVDIVNKLFVIGLCPKLIVCVQGTLNYKGLNY